MKLAARWWPTTVCVVVGLLGVTKVIGLWVELGIVTFVLGYITGLAVSDRRWHKVFMARSLAEMQMNVEGLGEVLAHTDPDDMPDGLRDAMTQAYRDGQAFIAAEQAPKRRFYRRDRTRIEE